MSKTDKPTSSGKEADLLTLAIHAVRGAIVILDTNNVVVSINQHFSDYFNCAEESLTCEKDVLECIFSMQDDEPFINYQNGLDPKLQLHGIFQTYAKVQYQWHTAPLIDAEGTISGRIWEFTEREQVHTLTLESHKAQLYPQEYEKELQNNSVEENTLIEECTALQEKNALLISALNSTPDGIVVVNNSCRIIEYNHQFLEMTGVAEEFLQQDGFTLCNALLPHIINPLSFLEAIERTIEDMESVSQAVILLLNGRKFEYISSPIVAPNTGEILGRLWEIKDITQELQKEERLWSEYEKLDARKEELTTVEGRLQEQCEDLDARIALLNAIFNSETRGIIAIDKERGVIEYNKLSAELLEIPKEILETKDGDQYYNYLIQQVVDTRAFAAAFDENSLGNLSTYQDRCQSAILFKSGKILEYTSSQICSPGGEHLGRVLEFRDITSQIQKEEELWDAYGYVEEQKEKISAVQKELHTQYGELVMKKTLLTAILDSSVHGILVIDEHENVLEYNRSFATIWEISDEMDHDRILLHDGKDGMQIVAADLRSEHPELQVFISTVTQTSNNRNTSCHKEISLKNGVVLDCFVSPVISHNGEYFGKILEFRDISVRINNEQKLKDAYHDLEVSHQQLQIMEADLRESSENLKNLNIRMGILSSITRHDIVNQLMVIAGVNDILSDELQDGEYKEWLQMSNRALLTVRKHLEFLKSSQESCDMQTEWHYLSDLLDDVIPLASSPHVKMNQKFDPQLMVCVDSLFEKVLYTLIENAIRHGEKITQITVSFEDNDGKGILSVEDDGVGIPDNEKIQIFYDGIGKNTGLGLFLSKGILDATGIEISECGEFGKGARFELMFQPDRWKLAKRGEIFCEKK